MCLKTSPSLPGSLKPTETGFYYLNSRYYNPEVGRFLNADAFASTDISGVLSTNMFAYCENNPVMRSDEDGEFWNVVVGALVGRLVSAAENIASGFATMCKSALDKVGKGLFSLFFGARNKSAVNPHREVRIHAFGG